MTNTLLFQRKPTLTFPINSIIHQFQQFYYFFLRASFKFIKNTKCSSNDEHFTLLAKVNLSLPYKFYNTSAPTILLFFSESKFQIYKISKVFDILSMGLLIQQKPTIAFLINSIIHQFQQFYYFFLRASFKFIK